MARIYVQKIMVTKYSIDANDHVNNLEYMRWMQDVAIAHSDEQGWTWERYKQSGKGWVAGSHYIKYIRPAFLGDAISILTWVADMKGIGSPRKYLFWRESDRQILAKAETMWVLINLATGRPVRIPPELQESFEIVAESEEDVLQSMLTGNT